MKVLLFDLLEKAKKEEEGLDLVRLRDEIKKGIKSENGIILKFLRVMESFEDIIPDEKQRYHAAVRALSATSGQSTQDILECANHQIAALEELKKGVLSALPGFRDELKAMESRSQEIRSEIAKLREEILRFEKEEQEILGSMEARKKEVKTVEEAVSKLFADLGAEISGVREKIVEFTGEKASPMPAAPPDSVEHRKDKKKKGGTDVEGKIGQSSETKETEWAKECPMCGGLMNFHMSESMWVCYSCGHDESTKDKAGDDAAAVAPMPEPVPTTEPAAVAEPAVTAGDEQPPGASAPAALPLAFSPPVNKPAPRKKACPACRKLMDWHEEEKSWLCPFCEYRRRVF